MKRHPGNQSPNEYDPLQAGIAFGMKELERVEYERKFLPDQNYPGDIIDHGAGLTYDEYGFLVEQSSDPFTQLTDEDRAVYGPPDA